MNTNIFSKAFALKHAEPQRNTLKHTDAHSSILRHTQTHFNTPKYTQTHSTHSNNVLSAPEEMQNRERRFYKKGRKFQLWPIFQYPNYLLHTCIHTQDNIVYGWQTDILLISPKRNFGHLHLPFLGSNDT